MCKKGGENERGVFQKKIIVSVGLQDYFSIALYVICRCLLTNSILSTNFCQNLYQRLP